MEKKIVLERRRSTDYIVNHDSLVGGTVTFYGAKKGIPSKREVSEELFNYLASQTTCFKKGKLFIVDDEIRDEVGEEDSLKNSHTKDEVVKILTSNTNSMKTKMKDITEDSEKRFFVDIAMELHKEGKFDSSAKRNFLVEWAGIKKELVAEMFDEE